MQTCVVKERIQQERRRMYPDGFGPGVQGMATCICFMTLQSRAVLEDEDDECRQQRLQLCGSMISNYILKSKHTLDLVKELQKRRWFDQRVLLSRDALQLLQQHGIRFGNVHCTHTFQGRDAGVDQAGNAARICDERRPPCG